MSESIARLIFAAPFGPLELMAIPPCPHEGCGWFMPELCCPVHGNFGMTYLFARLGSVTWVRPVLGIPREALNDEELRWAMAEYDRRVSATATGTSAAKATG